MMKTTNTGDLRRSSIMPGKGQMYKKPMKKGAEKNKMNDMKKPMKKAMKKKGK